MPDTPNPDAPFNDPMEEGERAARRTARAARNVVHDSAAALEREWADLKQDFNELVSNPAVRDLPEVRALKERVQESLRRAGDAAADVSHDITRRAKHAATMADDYAHDEPWKVAGVAVLAGLAIGLLLSRR